MDPEQLAAYVAGELDADERTRIEAALARDPALRAEVERLEVAERALDQLEPARPREGFEERLRAAVTPALDETLGEPAAATAAWAAGGDELAARRAPGRWVTAAIGAAAGVALLGVAGVALLGVPGTDDAADETAMEAVDDAADGELGAADADGPVVLATDRDLDDATQVLDEPALERLRAQRLDLTAGGDLARAYTEQLHAGTPRSQLFSGTESVPETEAEAPDDGLADADGTDEGRTAAGSDEQAVSRCLDVLLEGAGDAPPIPVYVELLRFEGEPAIAYGMLTPGRDGQAYERIEVWVVDRADCQVRELRQDDG